MARAHQIITATKMGDHALRLIGTTDIDGNGTKHEVADVDPIVLFDFVNINTSAESPFRPHPHAGLTAMSFLPVGGNWMAWDSLEGDSDQHLQSGGLYFVHAGTPAFHHEFPSPDTVAAAMEGRFLGLPAIAVSLVLDQLTKRWINAISTSMKPAPRQKK